ARDFAASISAVMTAVAYKTSAEMAEQLGAFNRYKYNAASMGAVIKQHIDVLQDKLNKHKNSTAIESRWVFELQEMAITIWKKAENLGNKFGYRNAQVTVVAPTGTIGLLMDCDTLGIEPEFSLLKEKKLAGGEIRKIMNRQVIPALHRLNYPAEQIQQFHQLMIDGNIDAALSYINEKDRSVFATAADGSISINAHLEMMAALQPFISGAISKTVNLKQDATVDDIQRCFYTAWKLGLKSISVYRDGCKASQPLNSSTKSILTTSLPDKPLCNECGFYTIRQGSCFHCPNCGNVIGCS
ncbi:MAG: hypothetical protein RIQ47_1212, partial [Bacteroidota bacterium]